MWCVFDASERDAVSFWHSTGGQWSVNTFRVQHSLEILPSFEKFLREQGVALTDLQGLGVVQGKGSFTSSRVVATIVNSLALATGVIVTAFHDTPSGSPEALFAKAKSGAFVAPEYSAPPSIGTKTKREL